MMTPREARRWLMDNGRVEGQIRAQRFYRWLREGRFPNARKDPSGRGGGPYGVWRIPLADLVNFVPPTRGRRPKKKEIET